MAQPRFRFEHGPDHWHDGIELAHHEEPQIAVHMLAAVPNGTYVECFPDPERDPLWASFILNRAPIKDGIISVHAAILPAAAGSRSGHAVRHYGPFRQRRPPAAAR